MKQHTFRVEYSDGSEPKVFSRPYGFLEGNDPRNPVTGFRCIEEAIFKVVDEECDSLGEGWDRIGDILCDGVSIKGHADHVYGTYVWPDRMGVLDLNKAVEMQRSCRKKVRW